MNEKQKESIEQAQEAKKEAFKIYEKIFGNKYQWKPKPKDDIIDAKYEVKK